MTLIYSETEVVAAVTRLTRVQLTAFVEAGIVQPVHTGAGPGFRQIDLQRMDLLCELSDQFDLNEEALEIIISLIDQLHGVRAELRTVLDAIADEPADVRARIANALTNARLSE